MTAVPVALQAKWVLIPDGDRLWRFDAAFLRSDWRCSFGSGCRGIHPTQDPRRSDGCCTYGAGITDAEDFGVVTKAAQSLTEDEWQFARYAKRKNWWKRKPNGEIFTRVVEGGCIFLNRPGFSTGPGCALHARAIADGINALHRKPNVCWQLPLRVDEDFGDDRRTTTVRRWERLDFGTDGEPLHWWCTEGFGDGNSSRQDPANRGTRPAWQELEPELRALCGDQVFELLAAALG
jgi:hypothetical protein